MDDQEALDLEIAFQEAADENDREVEANFANLEGGQGGDGEIHNCLGGYEYEFVDGINDDQKCPVCLFPMKDPVQIESCGHRLCRECLNGILRKAVRSVVSGNPVCPKDREIININKVFSDKGFARGMLSLEVRCLQSDRGCLWVGQLRHAEEHIGECSYEDQNCLACDALVQRRHLEMHQNDSCPKRIIECAHCQDEYTFMEKQQHEEVYCRRFPLTCPNSCGKKEIPREELQSHLSEKCLMSEVTCPYAKAGCPFQDKRVHLIDHLEASVEDHLEMTFSSLLAAETELSVCHNGMTELQQKFHDSEENNRKLSQLVEDHREQIRDLTLETKRLEMENIKQTKTIEEMFKKNKLQIKQWIADMNCKIASQGTKIEEAYLQLERKIEEKNSRHQKTTADIEHKNFQPPQLIFVNGVRTSPCHKSPDVRKTVVEELPYASYSPPLSIRKSQTSRLETP